MSDLENAKVMLTMAGKDLKALIGMKSDKESFDDETFGFHAQQAVEKSLKAWLCIIGKAYPKIHDLEELFELLVDSGASIPESFRALEELTDFGTQYRYEPYEALGDDVDREETILRVTELFEHVERLYKKAAK